MTQKKRRPFKGVLFFDYNEYELHHSEEKIKWFFRRCLAFSAKWCNSILVLVIIVSVAFFPSTRDGVHGVLGFLEAYLAGNFTLQITYMGAATWAETKENKKKSTADDNRKEQ
jgi:hypothetical protein